jgi:hypothetical protein
MAALFLILFWGYFCNFKLFNVIFVCFWIFIICSVDVKRKKKKEKNSESECVCIFFMYVFFLW